MTKQMTSFEFHSACERIVSNEVYYNISCLMSHLSNHPGDCEEEIYAVTMPLRRVYVPSNQFRVIVVDDDVESNFELEIYELEYDKDRGEWETALNPTTYIHLTDEHAPIDLSKVGMLHAEDYEGLRKFLVGQDELPRGCALHGEYDDPEVDDYEYEIYEHWIVSDWLARKLEEQGESVSRDVHGMTVWGRATTGQAISMDYVIQEIVKNLHEVEIV